MWDVLTVWPFVSYILGGEELHAFGHLEGEAEQVVEGQGLRVVRQIVRVFVNQRFCRETGIISKSQSKTQ